MPVAKPDNTLDFLEENFGEVIEPLKPILVQALWFIQPLYGMYKPPGDIDALIKNIESGNKPGDQEYIHPRND